MKRAAWIIALLIAVPAAVTYVAPTVAAAGSTLMPPAVVSVSNPFAADPTLCGAAPVGTALRPQNEPFEPVIAVNPTNPDNIVVAYIVDGFVLNLVRATRDGGKTWTTTNTQMCGAANSGGADPYLAFNADGSILYLLGMSVSGAQTADQVVVNESRDGGFSWSSPATVLTNDATWKSDMQSVTTDPSDPAIAYVTYERHDRETPSASVGAHSALYVMKTVDGGATWSEPHLVFTAPTLTMAAIPLLAVEPDGTLVDVFEQEIAYEDPGQDDNIDFASRSVDGGTTWLPPVKITRRTAGPGSDGGPDCGVFATHRLAVDRSGVLYASVTQDIRPPFDSGTLGLSSNPRLDTALVVYSSKDDGATWAKLSEIDAPTLIGMPTIAAAPDGSLGMTYYQMEDATCGASDSDPNFTDPMDVWFARSGDHGKTWATSKVAGPFDGQTACFLAGTPAQGCGFSDYDGLVSTGRSGFVAAYELTAPYAKNGVDDIFWSRTK